MRRQGAPECCAHCKVVFRCRLGFVTALAFAVSSSNQDASISHRSAMRFQTSLSPRSRADLAILWHSVACLRNSSVGFIARPFGFCRRTHNASTPGNVPDGGHSASLRCFGGGTGESFIEEPENAEFAGRSQPGNDGSANLRHLKIQSVGNSNGGGPIGKAASMRASSSSFNCKSPATAFSAV